MTTSASLLAVDGLTVQVSTGEKSRAILRNVSFDLQAGQFLAIVGESGSGKTTLAAALIGLLPPRVAITAGRIHFDGKVLNQLSDGALSAIHGKGIAYVPQDPGTSLNPVKTIGAQLLEAFRAHETGLPKTDLKARAVALLDEVGIDRPELRLRQYPHQLSGGMKQRVLLAIAFANNPRVIVADEPTSALDVTVQKQVMAAFSRLVDRHGTTVIFITHDIALAADHATHILVMSAGQVVEHGVSEQMLRAPRAPSTRQLIENALHAPRNGRDHGRSNAASAIIDVDGLAKQFEQRSLFQRSTTQPRAVDGISFSVREGTTFALVGESGSGKTTTARLIIGLETASSGTIRLRGTDIAHVSQAQRREVWRDIQLVHQNPFSSLNPRASIGDIIVAPLAAHRIGTAKSRRAAASELLAQVGLPEDCIERRPTELSGGQRQRVAIARALALKARIIILDEPLSALDVVTQRQILSLLRRLQSELGLTYIFITHDLGVVREFADDVGVMHRGRLVELGPVRAVFERPATDYTRLLLEALPGRALNQLATQTAAQ